MADESNANSTSDASVTEALINATETKKQRAPRRPKATTEMMGGLTVAKPPRGRRKRSGHTFSEPVSTVATPFAVKRDAKAFIKEDGRKTRAKRIEKPVTAPAVEMDEMADLLQLEEENKRLRKSLAEKLRAENADLRKRLGLS